MTEKHHHERPRTDPNAPVANIVTYVPKPGKEAELLALVQQHEPALRKVGLVTSEPFRLWKAYDIRKQREAAEKTLKLEKEKLAQLQNQQRADQQKAERERAQEPGANPPQRRRKGTPERFTEPAGGRDAPVEGTRECVNDDRNEERDPRDERRQAASGRPLDPSQHAQRPDRR